MSRAIIVLVLSISFFYASAQKGIAKVNHGLSKQPLPGLIKSVFPSIEISENRYAGWQPVKENKLVHTSLFYGYELMDNGNAFGEMPAAGAFDGQEQIKGYQGKLLANSKFKNLGTTIGELLSDSFIIKGDKIDFLIGGGDFGDLTGLSLIIDNKIVQHSSGNFNNTLIRKSWDVSAYKGKGARLLITDKISKDLFCFPPFDTARDKFAFVLIDDIRQTDLNGKRVDSVYDKEHNFDFETVRHSSYGIQMKTIAGKAGQSLTEIEVRDAAGRHLGIFRYQLSATNINKALQKLTHIWSYAGDSLFGVKLRIINRVAIDPLQTQYYVLPGLLYNGNNIGIRAHYLNESFPEDAETIPGAYSIEDKDNVVGGWVQPQQSANDPLFSLEFKKDEAKHQWLAIYSVPKSVNLAVHDTAAQDEDHRFAVWNGFSLKKVTYVYHSPKNTYSSISNEKAGYGQMVNEAWKQLYPESGTNPPHTLTADYNLKMKTLLDPKALVQEVTVNGKKYRLWIVGRYILGKDFDFTKTELVPTRYIFNYTGFSWSGMLETAAYNGIKQFVLNRDSTALSLAVNSLDFFADNGMSPIGILYPNWDSAIGFSSVWSKELIDMGHLGDGLSGYIKCYKLMKDNGVAIKTNWLNIVKTSLDNIMARFPDGDVPGRINGNTGKAAYRDGILYKKPSLGGPNGINFLVWAFADYYNLTRDKRYLQYAEKMGDIILLVMRKYGVMSGMEADYFNVDKRMFHGALAAFNKLYENTFSRKWLEASILAGKAFGSWEYCYNVNFKEYPNTPNAYFDYRSIGGTPVDIKYSTNNTNFQQGATEFLKLWKATGDIIWFQRARVILHQGTQLSLTEDKRKWLNENSQQGGAPGMKNINPTNTFDSHVLGGGTEDVMMSWLFKGIWTSRNAGIISMYMLTQGFDSDDLLKEYGSLCYDYKWNAGGAIDMIDEVTINHDPHKKTLTITAHNMIPREAVYKLKLLNYHGNAITIDGKKLTRKDINAGIPIKFDALQRKIINIKENK